ncbi:MAG: hypothetical protein E7D27_09320 [Clostridium celatum]|nr:hypothetical protein [Clostridium celatum]
MGNNSIRSNIKVENVMSEIKMILSANKNKRIVVLEGIDDYKLLSKFVEEDVILKESFNSKQGVLEIVNKFKNNNKVIGIVDKDYDEIIDEKGLFYYDYSSMEVMMSNSIEAFESLCSECYTEKVNIEEFREKIFKGLRAISLLRKYNHINKLEVSINNIAICNILSEDNTVCKEKLLDLVNSRSESNTKWQESKKDVEKYIDNRMEKDYTLEELMYLTRGHDFIYMFSTYCSKLNGKHYKIDVIHGMLRCAYTLKHLKNSKLWTSLKEYSDIENIYFFREQNNTINNF